MNKLFNFYNKKYINIGRRKEATARVFMFEGNGKLFINTIPGIVYLQHNKISLNKIYAPLKLLNCENKYDIYAISNGGGLNGQVGAIQLALSKTLAKNNFKNSFILKSVGFLTRNSKVVERKKYGLKKARKAPQFSKR
jgi:small subunit ribosomal protein S9